MVPLAPGVAAADSEWNVEGQMLEGRSGFVSAKLPDGRIFITMGYCLGEGSLQDDTWIYDPQTNSLVSVASSPWSTESSAGVAMPDGNVYIFGGKNISTYMERVLVYDVSGDSWSTGTVIPRNATFMSAVAISDDTVLIAGGVKADPADQAIDECYYFCTSNSTFWPAPDLPQAIFGGVLTKLGSTVYYACGMNSTFDALATIYSFDLDGNGWSIVGQLPEPLYCSAGAAGSDGNLYLVGGGTFVGWTGSGSDHAYVVDLATMAIARLPDLTNPVRHAACFGTDDGRIMYLGGNDGMSEDLNVYSLKAWCYADASLMNASASTGTSAWLRIDLGALNYSSISGNVFLVMNGTVYASFAMNGVDDNVILVEMPLSESLPAGHYDVVIGATDVDAWDDQTIVVDAIVLTVIAAPTMQDQMDDLAEQNADLQGQLDKLQQQNSDLGDQLNRTQAELEDSISAKQDAMFGYVILVLVIISLVIGVIILVRKK